MSVQNDSFENEYMLRTLFLYSWHSIPGGVKPTYLKNAGHEVINPALDGDNFDLAVRTAQAEYDQDQPEVIVGSSSGGAVAMNIESTDTPLVLLCLAWKNWGTTTTLKQNREELVANSGLPLGTLIEVGGDHRLTDPEPLKAMLEVCDRRLRRVKNERR